MKHWTTSIWIAFSLSGVGVVLIIIFSLNKGFNDGSGVLNAELAESYGSFIGGLVGPLLSLAGFFLLYETIIAQRKTFQLQQFESKYFELIRFHRENVAQMTHRIPWDENEKYYDGARVFIELKSQFEKLFKTIKPYIQETDTITEEKRELATINIAYLILFFGTSKATREDLENSLRQYDNQLISKIIKETYSKKAKYNSKVVYYGGHQVRLSHYYRHLFQTVKYVDNTDFLTDKQKYEYVKILRAQLTQHELAIFFINSLSIGHEWAKKKYIDNYKIVKNLPKNFISEINPQAYFKNFKYEWEN